MDEEKVAFCCQSLPHYDDDHFEDGHSHKEDFSDKHILCVRNLYNLEIEQRKAEIWTKIFGKQQRIDNDM
jgi:hypothetical protein